MHILRNTALFNKDFFLDFSKAFDINAKTLIVNNMKNQRKADSVYLDPVPFLKCLDQIVIQDRIRIRSSSDRIRNTTVFGRMSCAV